MKHHNKRKFGETLGEMISSIAFLFMGVSFLVEALIAFNTSDFVYTLAFSLISLICFAAVFRFVIAEQFQSNVKK